MKVLQVVATMGTGGAEAIVSALVTAPATQGEHPCVASAGGWRTEPLVGAGVHLLNLPLDGRRASDLVTATARLRRWLAAERPDLVHAHNVKASAVAAAASGRSRVPVVTTVHGLPHYRLAARILGRSSDRVVAVSGHVGTQLVSAGLRADRLDVIENAVAPLPVRNRQRARRRLGLADDVPVVVCIARLARQKRHDLLIEAWPHVGGDALLLVVGDGPTRPELEAAVGSAGLSSRVRLLGRRQDVDWLLAAADLAVLATDWEGLPVSLLEAMTVGVPVLASRVGGVEEALGAAAFLVEPGSSRALAEGINALLADASARSALAAQGGELVAARFAPDRMLAGYRRLYDALVGATVRSTG